MLPPRARRASCDCRQHHRGDITVSFRDCGNAEVVQKPEGVIIDMATFRTDRTPPGTRTVPVAGYGLYDAQEEALKR